MKLVESERNVMEVFWKHGPMLAMDVSAFWSKWRAHENTFGKEPLRGVRPAESPAPAMPGEEVISIP